MTATAQANDVVAEFMAAGLGEAEAIGWAAVAERARRKPVALVEVRKFTGGYTLPDALAKWLVMTPWDTVRLTGAGVMLWVKA